MESNILWLFAAFVLVNLCTCWGLHQNPSGTLNLDKKLSFSWKINSTKKTIRFKVNACIYQYGWFLIGFQPQTGTEPKNFETTRGDVFVVWRQTVNKDGKLTFTWKVTDCNTFNNGTLQREKQHNYHLPKSQIKYKDNKLTAIVWRYLDTEDSKDIQIKPVPMFVFGSYGNDNTSKNWKSELKKIKIGIEDVFYKASDIDFFRENSINKNDGRNFVSYAEKLAEQHWIGLVIGLSAFFTILITCTVYCIAKKGSGFKKKHITMSFHKESEYDDEAKVAFLQSEET